MSEKRGILKKLLSYILRSWEDEPGAPTHPLIKILPPFILELLAYLLALSIVIKLLQYLL